MEKLNIGKNGGQKLFPFYGRSNQFMDTKTMPYSETMGQNRGRRESREVL